MADMIIEDEDAEVEDIPCGTEIIDWWSYQSDGYRLTDDTADSVTAAQPRWVLAQCWQRGDEYVYEALTDEVTLAEAEDYEDSDLAVLIAQAESTSDFLEREALIDQLGPLVRQQIKAAALQPTE